MRNAITYIMIILSVVTSTAETKYAKPFSTSTDTTLIIQLNEVNEYIGVESRVALTKARGDVDIPCAYSLRWLTAKGDSIVAGISVVNSSRGLSIDNPALMLTVVGYSPDGNTTQLLSHTFNSLGTSINSDNSLSFDFIVDEKIIVKFGRTYLKKIGELPRQYSNVKKMWFNIREKSQVTDFIIHQRQSRAEKLKTEWTFDGLKDYFNNLNNSPVEGFWKYLDRSTDDRYTRLGGKYSLAVAADGQGGYDIIYLEGAVTYGSKWKTGMLKGRLIPTIFEKHYDLIWYDSTMDEYNDELSAQVSDDGAILTLSFPLYESQLRFFKVPLDKK